MRKPAPQSWKNCLNKEATITIFNIQWGVQAAHAQHDCSTVCPHWALMLDPRSEQTSDPNTCLLYTQKTNMFHTKEVHGSVRLTDRSSHSFLGEWEAGAIRQEVELVGGRQKLEGCHGKREGRVAVNVVFSGGGVGCGVLSILAGREQERCQEFLWKQVATYRLSVRHVSHWKKKKKKKIIILRSQIIAVLIAFVFAPHSCGAASHYPFK